MRSIGFPVDPTSYSRVISRCGTDQAGRGDTFAKRPKFIRFSLQLKGGTKSAGPPPVVGIRRSVIKPNSWAALSASFSRKLFSSQFPSGRRCRLVASNVAMLRRTSQRGSHSKQGLQRSPTSSLFFIYLFFIFIFRILKGKTLNPINDSFSHK